MNPETIKVRLENGQTIDVVVLSKRASAIQIVLGQGIHSVKCDQRRRAKPRAGSGRSRQGESGGAQLQTALIYVPGDEYASNSRPVQAVNGRSRTALQSHVTPIDIPSPAKSARNVPQQYSGRIIRWSGVRLPDSPPPL